MKNPRTWILALMIAALPCSCGDGGGSGSSDSDSDSDSDGDSDSDSDSDSDADSDSDGDTDTDADTDGDSDTDGDTDADSDADADGPDLLYDGPNDGTGAVPGWSADDPEPLIVFSKFDAEDIWNVSMAEIDGDGVVGGMITEQARFWGWSSPANAPELLVEGDLAESPQIPGWDFENPFPIIALTRYASSSTWFLSMLQVDQDGFVSGPVTDEIKVWGWTSTSAPGAPDPVYEGSMSGSDVPGWSVDDPPPLIVLTRFSTESTWWWSMAHVSAGGNVSGPITDWVAVWGW